MAAITRLIHPQEIFYQLGLVSLSTGTFSDFEKSNLRNPNKLEQKILKHLRIKKLMSEGELQKALVLIRELRSESGDHISLLCDQASLFYLLKNFAAWSLMTQEIDDLLSKVENKLSPEAHTKTLLLMAKFFEEQGLIRKSYNYLKKAEKVAQALMRTRVRANIIRLLSLHSISTELSEYYYELKQTSQSEPEFNTYAEFLHALILAEAKLFGPISSVENLTVVQNENKIKSEDLSLIIFDLIQVFLLSGAEIPKSILEALQELPHFSSYEEKLGHLVLNAEKSTHLWTMWSSEMPLGNYFLLAIKLARILPKEQLEIFLRQFALLLKSIPLQEQRYWQSLIKPESAPAKLNISIAPISRIVTVNDIIISFKSKRTLFELVQFLFQCERCTLEECAEKVFKSKFNESYYHRIRRLVKRVNDEFESKLLPLPLSCDRSEIFLNQDYK